LPKIRNSQLFTVHLHYANTARLKKRKKMNTYSVELTSGIELIVAGNSAQDAVQNATTEAATMGQQVVGSAELLDCSISF
jgi:hypothetical protein